MVYCVWIVVEVGIVYLMFPETYNRTLEELSFMFEGKEVQEKVQRNINKQLELEFEHIKPTVTTTATATATNQAKTNEIEM